jgi:hypothetical protein
MIEVTRLARPTGSGALLGVDVTRAIEHVVSGDTQQIIAQYVEALREKPTPASLEAVDSDKELVERLFDALAAAKIMTAQVAMHLDREWRDKLFRQLDSLHEIEDWEAEDEPLQQASFATFLKAMLTLLPERRPGLGLSYDGHLIAAWTTDQDRLTIEFLSNDRVKWVLARYIDDEPDRFAGQMPVARLAEGLLPYHPEHWFVREGR